MFSPKHQTFTLSGTVLVFNDADCKLTMSGTTHGERAVITSAVLSGGLCKGITAKGLPWKVEMSDGGQPIIQRVHFTEDNFRRHNTREQVATVDRKGNWTFIASGHLQMSGTIASSPPITVKP